MITEEKTIHYEFISRNEFRDLAEVHDQHCVSLYIPTSRAGEEVDAHQGQLRLKNSLKELRPVLREYGLTELDIENYLEPVTQLLDDPLFWRNQSDCLAIFLSGQKMNYYTLPGTFAEFTYVSDHFYLKPLIQLFNGDGKFYILTISLREVKFYEGTRFGITEIGVEDLVPEKLEEAVGYDFREKSLQFRTGQGGEAGAMFHGQGSGKDDKKKELEKFLRAVDQGIMQLLHDESAPLILACVDHYYPVYQRITGYSNLHGAHISGNQELTSPLILHEQAWQLVESYFQENRSRFVKIFRDLSASGRTSFELNDIIPAAIDGKVEALFLQEGTDRYGLYDGINRTLIVDENFQPGHASLYNLAAIQTWLKSGHVYISAPEEMPFPGTSINALFRY